MEILSDFILKKTEGWYCPYGDFFLDPELPVTTALISHAHNDHAKPGHQHVICTPETAEIMQLRYKKNAGKKFDLHHYQQTFFIKEIEVTFFSAGHILGSAMILMQFREVKYLFTGDYKMQVDTTCVPIQIVNADVLITETTFANPEVKHPDVIQEINKLNNINGNIMLGVYALGKAQRINKLIADHCKQKNVFVHHSIFPIHQLYQKNGVDVGTFELYTRKNFKNCLNNGVYMVPATTFKSYQKVSNVIKIFASGWERLQTNVNTSLYISDHVDWEDILEMIKYVNPSQIWTIHGDGKHLQYYFKGEKEVVIL